MKQCCTSEPLKHLVNFQNSGWTGNTYLYHLFMSCGKSMKFSLFPYHFRISKFQFKKRKNKSMIERNTYPRLRRVFRVFVLENWEKERKAFSQVPKVERTNMYNGICMSVLWTQKSPPIKFKKKWLELFACARRELICVHTCKMGIEMFQVVSYIMCHKLYINVWS